MEDIILKDLKWFLDVIRKPNGSASENTDVSSNSMDRRFQNLSSAYLSVLNTSERTSESVDTSRICWYCGSLRKYWRSFSDCPIGSWFIYFVYCLFCTTSRQARKRCTQKLLWTERIPVRYTSETPGAIQSVSVSSIQLLNFQ